MRQIISYPILLFCLSTVFSNMVYADRCPTPEIIVERKISQEYEWTIDERRSLDDVLAVEKLYSARIKNNGEFIACYYSSGKNLLRMDAKPLKTGCVVIEYAGEWNEVDAAEQVCAEADIYDCQYAIYCDETTAKQEEKS